MSEQLTPNLLKLETTVENPTIAVPALLGIVEKFAVYTKENLNQIVSVAEKNPHLAEIVSNLSLITDRLSNLHFGPCTTIGAIGGAIVGYLAINQSGYCDHKIFWPFFLSGALFGFAADNVDTLIKIAQTLVN